MAAVINFPSFSTDPLKVLAMFDQAEAGKGAAKIYSGILAMQSGQVEWTADGASGIRPWLEAIGAPTTVTRKGKTQPKHLTQVSDGVKLVNSVPALSHLATLKAGEIATEVKAYLDTLTAEGTTLTAVLDSLRVKHEPRTPSGVKSGIEAIDTSGKTPEEVAELMAMRYVTYCIDHGIDAVALVEACL